jgi:hypothetical protein
MIEMIRVKDRIAGILQGGEAAICGMVAVEVWMGVGSREDERETGRGSVHGGRFGGNSGKEIRRCLAAKTRKGCKENVLV